MIIGLTGKNASGKGEVANYLKTKGFIYYSLSDELREEAKKRKLEPFRNNLINLGNELREENGPNYLATKINDKIQNNNATNFVIDSIRSPYEALELAKNQDFILVGVEAPIELRFKRSLERNRAGDVKTLEEYKQQEQRENLKRDTNQQVDETLKLAQKIIVNDGNLEGLHNKIDDLIKKCQQE